MKKMKSMRIFYKKLGFSVAFASIFTAAMIGMPLQGYANTNNVRANMSDSNSVGHVDSTHKTKDNELDKPILIGKNQRSFKVHLKANPTTGYMWFVQNYDRTAFSVKRYQLVMPKKDKKMVGVPGEAVFTFTVKKAFTRVPQSASIKFIYARPWESGGSEKIVLIRSSGE